jgi:hypothetical protein
MSQLPDVWRSPSAHRGLPCAALLLICLICAACGPVADASHASPAAKSSSTAVPSAQGKGGPQRPTDFAPSPQTLVFSGSLAQQVSSGRPNSCGWGGGPTGPEFGYGLYFQIGQDWYLFSTSTDATIEPYKGPGTYSAHAWLWSTTPGELNALGYQGTVQLVVATDRPPDTGTVSGSLQSTNASAPVVVNGGWTCTPGPQLGPG